MSEKIADVIKETENNKADRQEQYFFRTDQLTVGYDGKPLIREINIQLKKGEILTLIGPNGAGKSTILKSITRQLATISGTVYLDKEKSRNVAEQIFAAICPAPDGSHTWLTDCVKAQIFDTVTEQLDQITEKEVLQICLKL